MVKKVSKVKKVQMVEFLGCFSCCFLFRMVSMRAPFQILSIPYRTIDGSFYYCVFHRADLGQWQFVAGGGENDETPLAAAKRESFEESGALSDRWVELKSMSYIPAAVISPECRLHWSNDTYVIPEYSFGFECNQKIKLSSEHCEYAWMSYDEAKQKLMWDSNRTALYELNCRLRST